MGITGLIPFLDKASSRIDLEDLKGKTVAVDSYCWLHKGVYSCAEKLVRGEDCNQYINYCLKYVNMLLSYNIKPIMVFDGQHLPAKALTEERRRESRQEAKQRAKELLRLGKVEKARSFMRRGVDVTHEMALKLIKECRIRNVDCLVAPYEADAQMAWLNKVGIAHYVITEDSDLTLFGARNIIFKLDLNGCGLLVESDKLHLAMGCNEERYSFDKFRQMCILSGCDYLDSLPGIGLVKACKFILNNEEEDLSVALKKIPQYLNLKHIEEVEDEYIENFWKAEATFKHMYIFNPLERKMERLNALEDFQTDEKYCSNAGSPIEDSDKALHLALGNLNPFSLKQLDEWLPEHGPPQPASKDIKRAKHKSIWLATIEQLKANESHAAKSKPMSCASYFKKVDYISKNIELDISENLKAENSKPAEADVMAIYKQEVSVSKRKRRGSDDDVDETIAKRSTSLTTSLHLNPFVKVKRTTTDKNKEETASGGVCANASLLKTLSPSKSKEERRRLRSYTRKLNMLENCEVEIRSRYFAENIELAKESERLYQHYRNQILASLKTTDVGKEIEEIEKLSQQETENQAMLYHSPSPKKTVKASKNDEQILARSDSGIESLATSENNDIKIPVKETTTDTANTIEISDDDSSEPQNDSVATKYKVIKLETKKPAKTPRLGLSKTKGKPQKSTRSTRRTISPKTNQSEIQQKLSVFGFQKRPSIM